MEKFKNKNDLSDMKDKTIIAKNGNDNFMNRQTLPKWLVVWWWIAIISATPLYLRLLWEQTLLTWAEGRQMIGFTLIHNHTGMFLLGSIGYILVFIWIIRAGIYLFTKKKRLAKSTIYYLVIPLVSIALGLIPYNFWAYLGGVKF